MEANKESQPQGKLYACKFYDVWLGGKRMRRQKCKFVVLVSGKPE